MEYRKIGKTAYQTSVISLGTEWIYDADDSVIDRVVGEAIDRGINLIDMVVPGEKTRRGVGKAIKGKRDKLIIQGHLCSTDLNDRFDISRDLDTVKKYFEMMLAALETDYIDFGMLFLIDTEQDYDDVFNSNIIEYAMDLKEKGIVRHLGASSHNVETATRVINTGLIDLIMFPVNAAFDVINANGDNVDLMEEKANLIKNVGGAARAQFYRLCERKNIAIVGMKPFAGGKLLMEAFSPFNEPMTTGQCIQYALTRPGVVTALAGCASVEEVVDCVNYFNLSDKQRDYSKVIVRAKESFEGSCVYCNHCEPCAAQIHIAKVHQALDIALLDKSHVPKEVIEKYNALDAHGSDCTRCGSCEKRCPFAVPIIENMRKAHEIFGR